MDRQAGLVRLGDADDAVAGDGRAAGAEPQGRAAMDPAAPHIETAHVPVGQKRTLLGGGQLVFLELRKQGQQHLIGRHPAPAHGLEQLFLGRHRVAFQRRANRHLVPGLAYPAKGLVQGRPAQADEFFLLGLTQVTANGGAGLARNGQARPVRGHIGLGAPNDVHHVAIAQDGPQRPQLAVDLHPHGGVADIGVQGIGEIKRHGPARQIDQPALGREDEGLIQEQVELRVLHQLFHIAVLHQLGQLADGGERIPAASGRGRLRVKSVALFLVLPVGCDTFFGNTIHGLGADL